MHSPHRPEHTAAALKMPAQAQSGLAEPVPDVCPSEDPLLPAYSDTHTLERMHTKSQNKRRSHKTKTFHIKCDYTKLIWSKTVMLLSLHWLRLATLNTWGVRHSYFANFCGNHQIIIKACMITVYWFFNLIRFSLLVV